MRKNNGNVFPFKCRTFLGIIRSSAWKPGYQLGRKIAVDLFFVGGTDKVGAAALIT